MFALPCVDSPLNDSLPLENSSKDEETLKTYKNVYSKLLRADKKAPLVSRVELYMGLLQQLAPSEETSSS